MGYRDKRGERNEILRCNRFRARFGNVTARALIAGVRALGNILSESFIQPARNSVCVKSVEDKMSYFVPQNIAGKFVGRIAQNEEASGRMNPARPRFQLSEHLKLPPIARSLEDINV